MSSSRTVQRVVLPAGADADALALYVEAGEDRSTPVDPDVETVLPPAPEQHIEHVLDRHRLLVPAGQRMSFATYFNAFPAAYWQRWTTLTEVELAVRLSGPATVTVYRSSATGSSERVAFERREDGGHEHLFRLPLTKFVDGGWYWFDVQAGAGDAVMESASWQAPVSAADPVDPAGAVTIGITTYNRPSYLLAMLRQLTASPTVLEAVDEVLVVDQGTQKVRDQDDYAEVAQALGSKLRVIEQANLGGSGGFSRSMLEALRAGRSRYVLLLDDDVSTEPESILRGLAFADRCVQPTVVGGHMFSLLAPSRLHSLGEVVRQYRFWWGSAGNVTEDHDLRRQNLRATPWMHRRVDVDYNGWWMCMIPVEVLKTVGLSLPLFIKWDDAEFGLRAGKAGFPTVSLPGMAIWHVPWTEKDDALDWQSYFHQRNRLVAALLHSPYPRGGRMVRESLAASVLNLIAMQYSVADLRLRALEHVLSGPGHLHETLATTLPEVRAVRATYPDSRTSPDVRSFPAVGASPLTKDREAKAPVGRVGHLLSIATGALQQLRSVPPESAERPQARVPALDVAWWRLSHLDSALVSTMDGTGVSWYRRDRTAFLDLMKRTVAAHERLYKEWPDLSARYRDAAPELTSPETWARTLAVLKAGQGGAS